MTKVEQIQIGMLGVIIVLLLLQITGIVGGNSSSRALREDAKQSLMSPPASGYAPAAATPTAITPSSSSTPVAQTALPTDPAAAAPQPAAPTGPKTVMAFKEESFDFGTVKEGEIVKHTFEFKNSGKEPLTITNAAGSCGCTVPQFPKEPIAPGSSGKIVVEFNSESKTGKRNQTVTVTANTEPANTIIRLIGEVTPKAGAASSSASTPIKVEGQ